jgi:hypothetical protein
LILDAYAAFFLMHPMTLLMAGIISTFSVGKKAVLAFSHLSQGANHRIMVSIKEI